MLVPATESIRNPFLTVIEPGTRSAPSRTRSRTSALLRVQIGLLGVEDNAGELAQVAVVSLDDARPPPGRRRPTPNASVADDSRTDAVAEHASSALEHRQGPLERGLKSMMPVSWCGRGSASDRDLHPERAAPSTRRIECCDATNSLSTSSGNRGRPSHGRRWYTTPGSVISTSMPRACRQSSWAVTLLSITDPVTVAVHEGSEEVW